MTMTVELSAPERTDPITRPAPSGRLRRYARPALGLLLPVASPPWIYGIAAALLAIMAIACGRNPSPDPTPHAQEPTS